MCKHTIFSIHNTLYLEVHCPIVKPQVVVISDNGRATIDYGDVSIGQQMNRTITIQVNESFYSQTMSHLIVKL